MSNTDFTQNWSRIQVHMKSKQSLPPTRHTSSHQTHTMLLIQSICVGHHQTHTMLLIQSICVGHHHIQTNTKMCTSKLTTVVMPYFQEIFFLLNIDQFNLYFLHIFPNILALSTAYFQIGLSHRILTWGGFQDLTPVSQQNMSKLV